MYQIETGRQVLQGGGGRFNLRTIRRPRVSPTVLLLGLNSCLTDISAEMVNTVLPLYLLFALRLAPVEFGIIDGLYQGGSVLVRVAAGMVSDRTRQPKLIATIGYGLSALCKLGLVIVRGPWTAITALIMADRIGKGIRTAPRDAMISLTTPLAGLGTAFGVHRALDTAGAMLGPLIAFGLLTLIPDAFDVVFVVSFVFAILGVAILVLFVRNPPRTADASDDRPSMRAIASLLHGREIRRISVVAALLGLATMSDSFVYLGLQDQLDFQLGLFPLLYVATALVFMVLALPLGRLADRAGRGRIFLLGYAVLGLVYVALLLPLGALQVVVAVGLLGLYYAMTDGVLMAFASAMISPELRASGLGLVASASGLARLVASVAFGILWTAAGIQVAVIAFLGLLVAALAVSTVLLDRGRIGLAHA